MGKRVIKMNNREIKFIIVRNPKNNRLRHFKSPCLHHYELARASGYDSPDILVAGLFLEGQKYILESIFIDHLKKQEKFYIGNRLNFYGDIRLTNWLKARELESGLYYSKKGIAGLPEGD
jgi:hypothetical protein